LAGEFATPIDSGTTVASMTNEVAHLPITWLGINAVEVQQFTTVENIIVGISTGGPDQEFALPTGSLDPVSLQLEVEEEGVWRPWQWVEDCRSARWRPLRAALCGLTDPGLLRPSARVLLRGAARRHAAL
jgi:hypothetical protein